MTVARKVKEYSSPPRKLIQSFRKSRDGWKSKHRAATHALKLARNQARAVERSREHWRTVAREERRRVRALERELADLKNAPGALAAGS